MHRLILLFTQRNLIICALSGFTSGIPLYLLISLTPAWLRSNGVDLATIGFFSLIQLPYVWKFLWASFFDQYTIPRLPRRKGWLIVSQLLLLISIAACGQFNPDQNSLSAILALSFIVALFSASQDIVADAHRREILSDEELGIGNAIYINTYKLSSLIPGSLSLILADITSWENVFWITSLFMLPGIASSIWIIKETSSKTTLPHTSIAQAVIDPLKEFFNRKGHRHAITVLLFIFLYKLGDSMATALATPFYLDLGFSKTQIGVIAKNAGLWPGVLGGLLGGLWMIKLGINRSLWIFGVVQLVTIFGFAWLSTQAADAAALAIVVSLESLGIGLGTAAFVAFIARETNPLYTATQLALFTSLSAIPRTIVNASTGILVEHFGWLYFFLLCAALSVPGMLLLFRVAPWSTSQSNP